MIPEGVTDIELHSLTVSVDPKSNKPLLQKGSRKVEVLELRKLLANWNIQIDCCSNTFDSSLEKAVKRFQRRVFLEADGIVDPLTWQALYRGSPMNMPELRLGAMGAEVKQLQIALRAAGIYADAVDSRFGILTDAAVRNFQRRNGLVVDGVVGCSTWRSLGKVCCEG